MGYFNFNDYLCRKINKTIGLQMMRKQTTITVCLLIMAMACNIQVFGQRKQQQELSGTTRPVVTESNGMDDRSVWIRQLTKIASPVLENLAAGTLKKNMPFESLSTDPLRKEVSYLEAVGRTICGISPWLELGADDSEEGKLRAHYIDLVVRGLRNAVNPQSPDHLMFDNRHT